MTDSKGVVLLSGGLDSLVSLDMASKTIDIKLALLFDYGQKPFREEKEASVKIAKYYGIKHKIIKLPYLREISKSALVDKNKSKLNSLKSVWIPNRNGLFLNIAASICESINLNTVIFGANRQEAIDFPDNTAEFVNLANEFFKYSTIKNVKVIAPCLQFDKIQIINYAIDNSLPLELIKSCYNTKANTQKKHCGKCLSCKLLYEAILKSKKPELIKEIF